MEHTEQELALERTELSYERTALSVIRTNLAFNNTKLSVEQTHLSFLRTIVSLVGSAATVYKALPAIGVSDRFSTALAAALFAAAIYFIAKDLTTYPRLKKEIEEMEKEKNALAEKAGSRIYQE
ncbi:MAG: hypothetical protein IKI75_04285 [Lachnospiraceae bacterium]|nr:hypothetical protein [Lachnospiraceae bacterium]